MEPIRLAAFPFDSQITGYSADGLPEYDRASNSKEFAELLKGFFRDGVFSGSAMQVLAGGGLTATVSTGGVMVQGRVKHLTAAQTVEFETAANLPRLDRVIVRRDLSNSVRDLVLDVLTGTPATSPAAPALTRNETVWEICLATVRVAANATSIQQSNITDTRLDSSLCGIVAAVLNDFDTNTFYAQVQADLEGFKTEEKAEFDAWFENLKMILDENVAANLQNQINNRVSVTEQSFSNDEKAQARENIAALSYETQSLSDEQKAQARENIGAGTPNSYTLPTATSSVLGGVKIGSKFTATNGVLDLKGAVYEMVTFIAAGTYSKSATINTSIPYNKDAVYLGKLGGTGASVIFGTDTLLRMDSNVIESVSGYNMQLNTVALTFTGNGASKCTLSYINRILLNGSSNTINRTSPESIQIGPIYMLRKLS